MTKPPLFDRLREMVDAVELCMQTHHHLPALILLYSVIDQISWLASDDEGDSVRNRFQQWVDRWMLPARHLPCSSLDLYAARCGMLHTLTSDSDLSRDGRAKRLAYSYNNDNIEHYQEYLDNVRPNELIAIRVEDLTEGFRQGLANFIEHTMNNKEAMARIESRAMRYYANYRDDDLNGTTDKSTA